MVTWLYGCIVEWLYGCVVAWLMDAFLKGRRSCASWFWQDDQHGIQGTSPPVYKCLIYRTRRPLDADDDVNLAAFAAGSKRHLFFEKGYLLFAAVDSIFA